MSDKILDFNKKREANIENKRRAFERIVFNNFLGAYLTLEEDSEGIYPVELVDISKDGCMIQVPWDRKRDRKLEDGTEKCFRMYFTEKSYIPVFVTIKRGIESIGKNGITYMQYGCEFDKSTPSFETLSSFIDFMAQFAEHSVIDKGDQKVFFL